MRHVTVRDAALAAVRLLTADDKSRVMSADEIDAEMRKAGHAWSRVTIQNAINRDLAGIGTSLNTPAHEPVLERLPGRRYRLR